MPSNALREFLRDESGSYTLWSLVWFILYLGLGGLAVDVTDAYRNQTLLQATADSAALAAAMSIGKPGEDPVAEANNYASANMQSDHYGDVLVETDITLGTWDFANRTFDPTGTPVDAVHVVTRRADANGNPVIMSVLRILGLFGVSQQWDVSTDAVAVAGVSFCHNNGLIAGGTLSQTNANGFFENICLHGVEGMYLRNGDTFESGVAASTTCTDCVGPDGLDPSSNVGWDEAWSRGGENDPLFPLNAYMVDEYVQTLRALPDTAGYQDMLDTYGANYAGWDYLFQNDSPPARYTGTSLPATLERFTIYEIDCAGSELQLPETTMRNIGIITNCKVVAPSSRTLNILDTVIAVDWNPGDPTTEGIQLAAGGRFGDTGCSGMGVELYTNGTSINFAASGNVNMVRLISGWNIRWAASATGRIGVMAEAVNDIMIRTSSEFGLCENNVVNGPNQFTYRLVL